MSQTRRAVRLRVTTNGINCTSALARKAFGHQCG